MHVSVLNPWYAVFDHSFSTMTMHAESSIEGATSLSSSTSGGRSDNANGIRKRGMVLPFQPLSLAFDEIRYAIDMPQVIFGFKLDVPSIYKVNH